MFLSLVRPERISSPITMSAAVTSSGLEDVVIVVLMSGVVSEPLPCHCGQCCFKSLVSGNTPKRRSRNGLGDPLCSPERVRSQAWVNKPGSTSLGQPARPIRYGDDDAHCHSPRRNGAHKPRLGCAHGTCCGSWRLVAHTCVGTVAT